MGLYRVARRTGRPLTQAVLTLACYLGLFLIDQFQYFVDTSFGGGFAEGDEFVAFADLVGAEVGDGGFDDEVGDVVLGGGRRADERE